MTDNIIEKVRRLAAQGWCAPNPFHTKHDQTWIALHSQKGAYINALTYIADEATVDDIDTIKKLARIALGREWNRDGTPVETTEEACS